VVREGATVGAPVETEVEEEEEDKEEVRARVARGRAEAEVVARVMVAAAMAAVAAARAAAAVRAMAVAATATGTAATGTAAAAMVKVAHWAADRTTVAPPPGTCSGRSGGGGDWDAARVQVTMLPRKVQGWAKGTRRRSLALCECRLPKKLLEL